MKNQKSNLLFHMEAIITSVVWGTTFVSTKVLIIHGLLPEQIMLFRFILAYICIWIISPRHFFSNHWKDELLFLCLGLTGGSLYFLAENTALQYTQACNVAILVSITPLATAIVMSLVYKSEKKGKYFYMGAVFAFVGVILVELNGHFILKLNPIGDILAFSAVATWVCYGIILKKLQMKGYSSVFITRKVFFYGIITILPVFLLRSTGLSLEKLDTFPVLFNLAFLGIVASFLCYLSWNYVINKVGVITATNYLFLNPLATFITASIVLHEEITMIAILGCILILSGVYFTQIKKQK